MKKVIRTRNNFMLTVFFAKHSKMFVSANRAILNMFVCNFYVRINAILTAIIASLHAAKSKTEIVIGGSLQDVTLSDAQTGGWSVENVWQFFKKKIVMRDVREMILCTVLITATKN